jgi:hypothetical protein
MDKAYRVEHETSQEFAKLSRILLFNVKAMDVPQRFDDEHAEKISYIRQQTNQDIIAILNQAIDLYYQQLQPSEKTPLEIFEELGLVGCIEGDPNLSTNYKPLIHQHLKEKYEREQQ